MTVSVIIPTYNGASRILNILRALENQSVKDFEVIVAIDGSTDNTRRLLQNQAVSFKMFKVIEQTNKGRAAIRNLGANEASGELLIYYDDDMRPTTNSVEKHLIFHKNHQHCICGGNQLEEDKKCKTDIQKYKRHLSLKWTEKYHEGLNMLQKRNLFLTAANFSIPKSVFEQLGGFNENLTDAEDYELAVRAFENGFALCFDKSNIAWHDDFITCKSYIVRQRQYTMANEMLKDHIPAHYLREPINVDNLAGHKKLIYSFLGKSFYVNQIDKENFTWLPKKFRHQLYDYIITALGRIYPNKSI